MEWMTRSDVILLGIAAYIAVTSLVRLMQRRRDQLVADVQRQVDAHRLSGKKRSGDGSGERRDAA
jgi:hypothetical protein